MGYDFLNSAPPVWVEEIAEKYLAFVDAIERKCRKLSTDELMGERTRHKRYIERCLWEIHRYGRTTGDIRYHEMIVRELDRQIEERREGA